MKIIFTINDSQDCKLDLICYSPGFLLFDSNKSLQFITYNSEMFSQSLHPSVYH